MPNWKKVVVSGSAANLHSLNVSTDVTASNISSSGNIFGNLSENSSTSFKTVVVDPSTGQFYKTGSYGGGGGAGGSAFPFIGDAEITGSLLLSGSQNIKDGNLTISGSSNYSITITGSSTQNTSNGSEIAIVDTTRHTGNSYSYGPKITLKAKPDDGTYGTTTTINAISTVSGGTGLGPRTVINSNRELVYNNTTTGYNGVGLRIRNNTSPANRNTEHIFAMQNQSGGYAHIARSQMGTGRIFLHGLGTSGVYGMMLKANQNQYLIIGPQTSGTDGAEVVKITSTGFKTTGFIEAVGNITASGNISASGNITSAGLTLPTFTTNRVPFIGSNGELTTDSGFEYNSTTDQLKVHSLDVVHLTSSFITSSTIETSGSNIFGDDTTDTQTLIGTTKMTGSAQITGSLRISGSSTGIQLESPASSPGDNSIVRLGSKGTTTSNGLEIYTNSGYLQIGPQNSSYSHFYTDRGRFYFNKSAYFAGNLYSVGQDFVIGRNNGTSDTIRLGDNSIEFDLNSTNMLFISSSHLISGSAASTASFGTYLGDGSQLTGISAGTDFTQSLFVSPSGDNSTAIVGDMSKPFATILGATGSANPGDTIIVYPGKYIENNNLYKDGVNYHFIDGAIVESTSPVEPMWGGGGGAANSIEYFSSPVSITGHGEFINTSNTARTGTIFYLGAPSGIIEFKKAFRAGIGGTSYVTAANFAQHRTTDAYGVLTIKGEIENSGSGGNLGQVVGFIDGNINAELIVRQHKSAGTAVKIWGSNCDLNATMDVYSEGMAVEVAQRTSALTVLKGRYETLTSNQGTYYCIDAGYNSRGSTLIDAEVRGAIKIEHGSQYEGSTTIMGYQEVSNSPGGAACVIIDGQNQLSQRIYSGQPAFKVTGGYTTFDGTVRNSGYNSKVFDISGGTFNWKGTIPFGSTNYPTTRTDPNVVSGGELVIESQFECWSQPSQVTNEYMFNLSGGTLDIRNKLRNRVDSSNNGIINMTGGYLKMNGAELVHATQTGSFAYAIDLNNTAHSGSILNNCFTNLTPFGNTGSFTNEIVGGGTLFESHKLY